MVLTHKGAVSLAGKVVAITGGARGIGRATAETFLAAGAKVAIGDIDVELVAKTAAELGADPNASVVGLPLNVTDRESFAAFLDAVEAEFGPIDVLVNNAGIMPSGMFLDEEQAMTDRIIGINLVGVMTGSRLAAERFVARGKGHLVNIASLAGTAGIPGLATYCATKHAVIGFSEALYFELAEHGVQVIAVLPGIVRTELSVGANMPDWMLKVSTIDPEDVANAIVGAIGHDRPLVTVPRALNAMIKSTLVMPFRMQQWTAKVTGFKTAYANPDQAARAAYHRRVADL